MTKPLHRHNWQTGAACAGMDTAEFFPPEDDNETKLSNIAEQKMQVQSARNICRDCPALLFCRGYSVDDRDGVFGGLSANERSKLRSAYMTATGNGGQTHPDVIERHMETLTNAMYSVAEGQDAATVADRHSLPFMPFLAWLYSPIQTGHATRTHCANGHQWTDTSRYYRKGRTPTSALRLECRICISEKNARQRAAMKETAC